MSKNEAELTDDQYLRFEVLVPFYRAMEKKRQEDLKLNYIQDASGIYTEAIKLITQHTTQCRIDELAEIPIHPSFIGEYIDDRIAKLKKELEDE